MSEFNSKALDAIDTIQWAVRVTSFLAGASSTDIPSGLAQEGQAFVLLEVQGKLEGASDELKEALSILNRKEGTS